MQLVLGVVLLFLIALVALAGSQPLQKWFKSDDGSIFYIEPENKYNWFQAWNECARKNMSLIAIDTFSKHQQFDGLIRRTMPIKPQLWLGGHDNAVDNRYEWASTGDLINFSNWGPGQPDRAGNLEHCMLMWHDFAWHDLPCITHKLGFVCEENQLLKMKTKELELLKQNMESQDNDLSKYKNFVMYFNRN